MNTLITKLEKNGYELRLFSTENGTELVRVIQNEERYAPQISEKFGATSISETEFTIGTVSYGGLPVEEIKKVMTGYEKAIEAVEYFEEQLKNNIGRG